MDHQYCPGSKQLRQPAPEMFDCPSCGEEVEIWTDELKRDCSGCGTTVIRDSTMSCLEWCAKAAECVGDAAYEDYLHNRITSIRHRLLDQIRAIPDLGTDIADRAEEVCVRAATLSTERDVDWHIVLPASLLLEIGAETSRKMLLKEGLPLDDIASIVEIISEGERTELDDNARTVFEASRMTRGD